MVEVIHKKNKTNSGNVVELPLPEARKFRYDDPFQGLCDAFSNWMDNALPGDKFCYFKGNYVSGKKVGSLVKKAYDKGLVIMYQKKAENTYHYWVQRIDPRSQH